MLLTPSQVSVAASSGIVVFFTAALFLSGYAIQQRTLRNLREAIRPKPKPSPMIFLPDRFRTSTTELDDGTVVALAGSDDSGGSTAFDQEERAQQHIIVELTPTAKEAEEAEAETEMQPNEGSQELLPPPETKAEDAEARDREDAVDKTVPPSDPDEKPISRAERRRRIREEIKRLSQGETPVYYQRRLW